jgi:hypothetical protein
MFSLSGQVAGGLQTALDEVMERRLREQMRRQQEQQQAAELQMRRDEMAARAADRKADLAYRDGQVARADASDIMRDTAPGPISEETAGILRKVPAGQARLSSRKILEGVRPIGAASVMPGAMAQPSGLTGGVDRTSRMGGESAMADAGGSSMDASGPQSYSVLEPTQEQAEGQYRKRRLIDLGTLFKKGGMNEAQRRQIQGEAFGEGIAVPESLVGQTGEEKTEQEMANERRAYEVWLKQNSITSGQADRRAQDARGARQSNGVQKKALEFYNRLDDANQIMDRTESKLTNRDLGLINNSPLPNLLNNVALSPAGRQYAQALRMYTEARLRETSGAAVQQYEYENDRSMLARQIGDDEDTAKQRRQSRLRVADGMAFKAGPAYAEYYGEAYAPMVNDAEGPIQKKVTINGVEMIAESKDGGRTWQRAQ